MARGIRTIFYIGLNLKFQGISLKEGRSVRRPKPRKYDNKEEEAILHIRLLAYLHQC